MAVVNEYKFVGIDNDTSNGELNPFGSGKPSPIVTNNSITTIKSAALTADTTKELLTQPLIVEGGKTLTIKAGSADSFDIAVSYLNIKKEVTT
jgi:hypothetical protein